MKTRNLIVLLLALLGLSGCRYLLPESPYFNVHEIEFLYPESSERWLYFYGDPMVVNLDGQSLVLEPARTEASPWAVPGALWVNGMPLWREVLPPAAPKVEARYDPFTGAFEITTQTELRSSWYYDGFRWFRLSGEIAAGKTAIVHPVEADLKLSQLTWNELKVTERELRERTYGQPFVLFERAKPLHPRYRFDPEPWIYLTTSLRVQKEIPKVYTPLYEWRLYKSGSDAAYAAQEPAAYLACTPEGVAELWALAFGNRLPRPNPPALSPGHCLAGFFWGQKPTGGYRVEVRSGRIAGEVAEFTLDLKTPPPGSLTTQALTSPYVILELFRPVEEVRFYDLEGNLLARAFAR